MTRTQIEAQILEALNYNSSSPVTAVQTRIRNFVTKRERQILSLPGMTRVRTYTTTITTTADQPRLGLPFPVTKINRIVDTETQIALIAQSLDFMREIDPAQTSSGSPRFYMPLGYQAVAAQPSDSSTLTLQSTSGSDTQSAYLEGLDANGFPQATTTTLTGITAANSTGSWTQVTKFYVSTAATGTISLFEDSSAGTLLGRIGPAQTEGRVFILYLWPTPSDALTYVIDYESLVTAMAQNTDSPPWPEDFHDLLVIGGIMDEYEKTDDTRWSTKRAEYEERLNAFKVWLWWGQGQTPVAGWRGGANPGWSPIGGWGPAWPW